MKKRQCAFQHSSFHPYQLETPCPSTSRRAGSQHETFKAAWTQYCCTQFAAYPVDMSVLEDPTTKDGTISPSPITTTPADRDSAARFAENSED